MYSYSPCISGNYPTHEDHVHVVRYLPLKKSSQLSAGDLIEQGNFWKQRGFYGLFQIIWPISASVLWFWHWRSTKGYQYMRSHSVNVFLQADGVNIFSSFQGKFGVYILILFLEFWSLINDFDKSGHQFVEKWILSTLHQLGHKARLVYEASKRESRSLSTETRLCSMLTQRYPRQQTLEGVTRQRLMALHHSWKCFGVWGEFSKLMCVNCVSCSRRGFRYSFIQWCFNEITSQRQTTHFTWAIIYTIPLVPYAKRPSYMSNFVFEGLRCDQIQVD